MRTALETPMMMVMATTIAALPTISQLKVALARCNLSQMEEPSLGRVVTPVAHSKSWLRCDTPTLLLSSHFGSLAADLPLCTCMPTCIIGTARVTKDRCN